jgi:hypothetical protein
MYLRILALFCLLLPLQAFAAIHEVADPAALRDTMDRLEPGDIVRLLPGEWNGVDLTLRGRGRADAPIVFEAREPGTVLFTGPTFLRLSGSHLVVRNLVFSRAQAREGAEALFSFRDEDGVAAEHSRLTGCIFDHCNPPDPARRYPWIRLYGSHNRIDHNRFEGMNHDGVTVQVRVTEAEPGHRIDHNHFLNRPPGYKSNGFETLQIGVSQQSRTSARILVERNLFERCDGETEIISSKTKNNILRNNLFLDSAGTLTLRHGSGALVEDNAFVARGIPYSGGIRVVDGDHVIRGNYFDGLDGRTGGVVVFYCGIPDSPLNGYFPASNSRLEQNFFVRNLGNSVYLTGGFGRRDRVLLPENLTIRENIFGRVRSGGATVLAGYLPDTSFAGNLYADGVELGRGFQEGFAWTDFSLQRHPSGLWQPRLEEGASENPPLFNPPGIPRRTEVGPDWDLHLPPLHLLDASSLRRIARDPGQQDLRDALVSRAEGILAEGKRYSVTFNDRVPPSGNRNDYYSTGPYWWPNPDTDDGLPYVRRDGEFNPERDRVSDRAPLHSMVRDTVWMSLAYRLSGEERFASWGVEILRTWFLQEETRMRPNLNHAQAIPGITEGRDVGIIDAHPFAELVDALHLLQPALAWEAGERESLRQWFMDYTEWLLHHPHGSEERSATNNHGTAYDLQATALLAYLGKDIQLRDYLQTYTIPRIAAQITAEGHQPEELSRTRTWSYCTENLEHFMKIARISQDVGIDLFHHEAPGGASLKIALEFLLPYVCEPDAWPYPQVTAWQEHFMENILAIAEQAYPDLPLAEARQCLKASDNRLKAACLGL